jgi:hypothetical protein
LGICTGFCSALLKIFIFFENSVAVRELSSPL